MKREMHTKVAKKLKSSLGGLIHVPCADPESFVRGGPNLISFFLFLVNEGIDDPNITIDGPASARQRNAI